MHMNKGVIVCAIASVVITGPLSYVGGQGKIQESSIAGRISPASEAATVCCVRGEDSVKATLMSGNFFVKVKPGKYKLIVNTKTNNRVVQLDNIEVKKNQALDVGEIILQ